MFSEGPPRFPCHARYVARHDLSRRRTQGRKEKVVYRHHKSMPLLSQLTHKSRTSDLASFPFTVKLIQTDAVSTLHAEARCLGFNESGTETTGLDLVWCTRAVTVEEVEIPIFHLPLPISLYLPLLVLDHRL